MAKTRDTETTSVKPASLTDTVYRALKEDILSGRLGSQDQINESQLAQRFGVSKTPVREALRQLAHDGLVVILPRRGYVVRSVGLPDILEVLSLRRWIEPELAAHAAQRATPSEVDELRSLVAYERGVAGRIDEVEVSVKIHESVALIAGNKHALALLQRLLDESERIPWLTPRSVESSADEHDHIVEAIASGDGSRARALMRSHLETTQQHALFLLGGT